MSGQSSKLQTDQLPYQTTALMEHFLDGMREAGLNDETQRE
jgi:hypothetical protein